MTTQGQNYEVVICGSGSAALLAAISLAQTGIKFCILEKRDGPLDVGQADGVQCRTVEIFDSLNIAEDLLREAYHVLDLTFWSDGKKDGKIVRTSASADTPPGLSYQPHVILNQARINGLLLEKLYSLAPNTEILYEHQISGIKEEEEGGAYPVSIETQNHQETKTFRAKYALACDGAHSVVRRSLGITMVGETSDAVWGVIDFVPKTDFPDIRRKTTIHSKHGSLLIIPREGGQLVRFYLQMPHGVSPKSVSAEGLIERGRQVLEGYSLRAHSILWWSAYTIGQRIASAFSSPSGSILLAGDACHTHSPKAGQGMNVSLQDGYNIGWKLGHVLQGKVSPSILYTYVQERRSVAQTLIDFDRELTGLYSKSESDTAGTHSKFRDYFLEQGRYMAGLSCRYEDSILTSVTDSEQHVAKNITPGMRCPSAQLVRYCDGRGVQLLKALSSESRWRILIFAGDLRTSAWQQKVGQIAASLEPILASLQRLARADEDFDSFVEPMLIFSSPRFEVDLTTIPRVFRPLGKQTKLPNLHNMYTDEARHDLVHGQVFDNLGINPEIGAIIVVRRDQHVSLIIEPDNIQRVNDFFSNFVLP